MAGAVAEAIGLHNGSVWATPGRAVARMRASTSCGVSSGASDHRYMARPATCGVAIDEPLRSPAVVPALVSEKTSVPTAAMLPPTLDSTARQPGSNGSAAVLRRFSTISVL